MGRKVWIVTASLTAAAAAAGAVWADGAWVLGLAVGAAWGLANAWCLTKAVHCFMTKQKGWILTGWLTAKFIGLYGALAFLLIVLRLSPLGWLSGFSLSLVGLGISRNA
ncbi:MAG: hypothetical protein HYZ93_04375 [Candidatus Omnitrophica bacterium]|nr:hypothetical protein [Candidatus Omnitrophota bacterium]